MKPNLFTNETGTHWSCPKCQVGEMVSTREYWAINPPKFHHICDNCQHTEALAGGKEYPDPLSRTYVLKPDGSWELKITS